MLENCFNCDQAISEKARFCGKCVTNVRCCNCGADLHADDRACEMCATEVVIKQTQQSSNSASSAPNHIIYSDAKKGINLEARVTDTFGTSAAALVGMIRGNQSLINQAHEMPIKMPARVQKGHEEENQEELGTSVEEISDKALIPAQLAPVSSSSSEALISDLFEERDDKWYLVNPEIKATSKSDFVKRAICLFLQFQHNRNIRQVPRTDVIELLRNCSAWDSNARDIISKTKSYIQTSASHLTLTLPGTRYANDVLAEVYNDEVSNAWKVGTTRRSPRKGAKKLSVQDSDPTEAE
jgi:hypothetical protein